MTRSPEARPHHRANRPSRDSRPEDTSPVRPPNPDQRPRRPCDARAPEEWTASPVAALLLNQPCRADDRFRDRRTRSSRLTRPPGGSDRCGFGTGPEARRTSGSRSPLTAGIVLDATGAAALHVAGGAFRLEAGQPEFPLLRAGTCRSVGVPVTSAAQRSVSAPNGRRGTERLR
jgi:hypothetical protein